MHQRARRSAQSLGRFSVAAIPIRIGFDDISERDLMLLSVDTPSDVPDKFDLGSQHFVALVAWDAVGVEAIEVGRVARILLDAGCVYFCCWGPGCERVHDIIDEEYVGDGRDITDDDSVIMTTWHNDVSLEEATWFALHVAFPDDRFFDTSKVLIAICIGNATWRDQLKTALMDPGALSTRVVGNEDQRPNTSLERTRER